jgi:methyl-accepting chemotaxis protein
MKSFKIFRLAHRLALLVTLFAVGMSLFGACTYVILEKLEVNGPVYKRISLGKDLIADILPPPVYIIESYQVALEMAGESGVSAQGALERLKALEKEYNDRHTFWSQQSLGSEVAKVLLKASFEPAQQFYRIAFNELGPAALSKDHEGVVAALKRMRVAYEVHRTAINDAVKIVAALNDAEEAGARTEINFAGWLLAAIFAGSLIVAVAVAFLIVRGLLKELGGEPYEAVFLTRSIAAGKLNTEINLEAGDTSSLLHAIKAMQLMLGETVSGIQHAVDSVRTGSEEIASGNMDLSARTEHHASALEQTAATLENLASTVKQTASSAIHANGFAQSACGIATRGSEVMTRVVGMMDSVRESSQRISEISNEIDGIAFQTNILSLNAAVEAARAGAQGAGFAVTDIIATITEAANEQSMGLAEVNTAVAQMEQVTQQNAALVEEASAAASSLHEQADKLAALAGSFQVSVSARVDSAPVTVPQPRLLNLQR